MCCRVALQTRAVQCGVLTGSVRRGQVSRAWHHQLRVRRWQSQEVGQLDGVIWVWQGEEWHCLERMVPENSRGEGGK